MATKKETLAGVIALIESEVSEATLAAVTELLGPKAGGGKDVTDYTVFDADGDVQFVFCTVHKQWEPVVDDDGEALFVADAKSKNGLRRYCAAGDKQWQGRAKAYRASKEAIMQDLLEGEIDNINAKELLEDAEKERHLAFVREDGLGETEKPVLEEA